jgi:hypothetical protein
VTTVDVQLPGLGPAMDIHDWLTVVPENEWLVNGLVANQSLNMIKAKREVGKSLLACDFIAAYVTGEPEWLGRSFEDTEPRGNVLYMVTDANAEAEVSRQLGNLGVPRGRVELARHSGEMRDSVDDWVKWGAWIQTTRKVAVLVVDNGTGMSNGVVDTEATGTLFKRLRALTGPMGITVILIHHEKNSGGTAGNYSWESESRWRLRLAAKDDRLWASDYRELEFDGGNVKIPADLPDSIPLRMPRRSHPASRFTLTDRRNATPEERSAKRENEHTDKFTDLTKLDRSWASYAEMGATLGVSAATAERIVKERGHVRDRATGRIVPRS